MSRPDRGTSVEPPIFSSKEYTPGMTAEEARVEQERIALLLQEAFDFPEEGFSSPSVWTDGVGISRVKESPDGFASLYKIGILPKEIAKESSIKHLSISVSYGKKISEGISLGSSEKGLYSPIDFSNRDDFTFDISTRKFFKHQDEITPHNLLKNLEDYHMKPTFMAKGFPLRSKLWFWRVFLPSLVKLIDLLLLILLWAISGETIKRDILGRLLDGMRTERTRERIIETPEFKEVKKMEFFGYEAKRWSVVFYCLLHLSIFGLLSLNQFHSIFVENLFSNNFTALCYVVVSFAFTEALVPKLLKRTIEWTPKLYGNIAFRNLQF